MVREDLIRSARRYADRNNGAYGLSFWSWPGMTATEILSRVKRRFPEGKNPVAHGKFRQSTAGAIREAAEDGRAYQLTPTSRDGHYTLTFPSEPSESDWERLEGMFGLPEPNPAAD